MLKSKNRKRGFTLVEVIVVLVILAILAAIMIPALTGWIEKSKKKTVIAETRNLHQAVQAVTSELYGTSEWKAPTGKNYIIANSTGVSDNHTGVLSNAKNRYNEVVKLSEIPNNSKFTAIVNEKGKVQSAVFLSDDYLCIYSSDKKKYESYKVSVDKVVTDFVSKHYPNTIICVKQNDEYWSCSAIRQFIGLAA